MIEAQDLCRRYGKYPHQVTALQNLTLHIDAGERVAIIGKSGSGKSTLLNLLAGLDHPTSGKLQVDSRNLDQLNRREMSDYRLRTVGIVFQSFQLIPQRSAIQNVELPLLLDGETAKSRRLRAAELLRQVGLEDRKHHYPYQLSGGEQQRVAIARALINHPKLILADEPTGNLDAATADNILELLETLCSRYNTTLIVVTHDEHVANRVSQRKFCMNEHRLHEMLAQPISNGGQG
ncbi:MAG TPA: ABC transporter ATP-binding protein [Pirellulaceae bacterium]|nr:ABC transporter ATP-binding protein [Pirellulaceae bacterium]HMO91679.1 ABC transporter ATP-binding protein [Pirellulaceae bacterium]HMP68376.1 ABC transporter ATP-binding protein [Pirellulaceae bacterium]